MENKGLQIIKCSECYYHQIHNVGKDGYEPVAMVEASAYERVSDQYGIAKDELRKVHELLAAQDAKFAKLAEALNRWESFLTSGPIDIEHEYTALMTELRHSPTECKHYVTTRSIPPICCHCGKEIDSTIKSED